MHPKRGGEKHIQGTCIRELMHPLWRDTKEALILYMLVYAKQSPGMWLKQVRGEISNDNPGLEAGKEFQPVTIG